MSQCQDIDLANPVHVGMGQAIIGASPSRLVAVLGSCVAVSLYAPSRKIGILGHVVLPHTKHHTAMPTKYADLAVPYMLAMLVEREVSPLEIIAKVVGGASMFGENGMPRIGDENVEAVLRSLDETRIRTAGTHVGGTTGRRIELDCDTGILTVGMVGLPSIILD